jgi:hypoxanthine phosphoribosyltransferase
LKNLVLFDKEFRLYIRDYQIEAAVKRVASEITDDLSDAKPLFISVLNGSFMFTADLMKHLNFHCNLTFIKLSSYEDTRSKGEVSKIIGLNENIEGRTVVVVEDIVESGTTLFYFLKELWLQKPADIKVASMFFKPEACKHKMKIDYLGMEIENRFVVGYGLDCGGLGRNYKDLYLLV